jgi:hypothetical protein
MNKFSPGAALTWQQAAQEAAAARSEFIEPDHILSGACSLGKALMQQERPYLFPHHCKSHRTGKSVSIPHPGLCNNQIFPRKLEKTYRDNIAPQKAKEYLEHEKRSARK